MSKFVDKLKSVSKSSIVSIGFHPSVSELKGPSMLLIVRLSGTQVKEAKIVSDVNADAGLILSEGPDTKIVKQMVGAVGDVPMGVFVKGMSEEKINEITSVECDFVVFGIRTPAAVLYKAEVGKFLMIEPSLDQSFVRAINSLEVDGVFIGDIGEDSFVAVEHLLVCRSFVGLLEKPIIMALPSLVTKDELTGLWQAGVDGVVAPSTQSVDTLVELKKMIDNLPKGARGRRSKASVKLPNYGGLVAGEEDEEQEEI
jgi:hypothetical protein